MGVEYFQSYQHFERTAESYAGESSVESHSQLQIRLQDTVELARLAFSAVTYHSEVKHVVSHNMTLPEIVRNDPPSFRSVLWMMMIRDALIQDLQIQDLDFATTISETSPQTLFALTRCWLNGADDVMDQSELPFKKGQLEENTNQRAITSALGKEFLRLYRQETIPTSQLRETVRQYRLLRDFWIDRVNCNEDKTKEHRFENALKYNIEAMGPITYILTRTLSVDIPLEPNTEHQLNQTLTYYAAAGKMIDDMTDWLKDYERNESNLFTLMLQETGELETVVTMSKKLPRFLGKKTFIPISLFKIFAPHATDNYLKKTDQFIAKLEDTPFTTLSMSMKGVRQMMWAYALNEGLPQVNS